MANVVSVIRMVEAGLARPANADSLLDDLARVLSARHFEALVAVSTYPKGAVLYTEGQAPQGVFIISRGRAKLTMSSMEGKAALLRIAEAGDIVGLPATISGRPYEVTAEASEDLQVKFIRRADFLKLLAQNGEACLKVAEMLALIYHSAYREVRYLALSNSAVQKLASFLLDQLPQAPGEQADGHVRIRLTLTHADVAAILGTSRETITRTLTDLKNRGVIEVHGATIRIVDLPALRTLAGSSV